MPFDAAPSEIQGWTADADQLLAEYDDPQAFQHDCTIVCASCEKRWFAGWAQRDVELTDAGEFLCRPCTVRIEQASAPSFWTEVA